MVDAEVVLRRLAKLDAYLAVLDDLGREPWERFEADPIVHGAAERYLHLAAEAMIDIGNHVVADRGLGTPTEYRGVFQALERAGLVSPDLSARLQRWAAFRNVLVHFYADLDLRRVYDALQGDLGDVREFIAAAVSMTSED
jgi:uncharacterized protein YutE (UPF0331/DUF86 family)